MTGSPFPFDIDEVLHLAGHAISTGQTQHALSVAKQGAAAYPESGEIAYLLGALYAEIGMIERSSELLQKAIPTLQNPYPAIFQLGLLDFTSGHAAQAQQHWQQLAPLDEQHYLRLFSTGLLALVDDDFDRCRALIEEGLSTNSEIPALNVDMRKVLERIDEKPRSEGKTEASAQSHVLLSGYAGRKKS